jgi:hypothetical protein
MSYLTLNSLKTHFKKNDNSFYITSMKLTNLYVENSMEFYDFYVDFLHPIMIFHHKYLEYSTMQCLLKMVHWINQEKSHHTRRKKTSISYEQNFFVRIVTIISISSCKFLHVEKIASDVPNSKYHNLFFILHIIKIPIHCPYQTHRQTCY